MGFGVFNARRSAKNFTDEEFAVGSGVLPSARRAGLSDAEHPADGPGAGAGGGVAAQGQSDMGVDAVLVQDWGLLTLAREIVPDVPLHASTQMSLFTLRRSQRGRRSWDWSAWCSARELAAR